MSKRKAIPPAVEVRKSPKVSFLVLLSFLFLLAGGPARLEAKQKEIYLIGRDDVLEITVWQSPDLSKAVTVQSDGTIDYPILGNLPAAGFTPEDLEKTLREKLAQGYVKNPQVDVAIKEYNSKKILVFGQAGKAGLYKLKGEIPLLELLFMIGGVSGDGKRMTVIRPAKVGADAVPSGLYPAKPGENPQPATNAIEVDLVALLSKGDLSQNIMIHPGDTIYVSSGTGLRYYVLGQVGSPGPYEWIQDITVLEAIKLAGGATARAAPNRIKVRKQYKGEKQELKVNIVDIMKGKKKDDVVIKPGDTIIVPESWI